MLQKFEAPPKKKQKNPPEGDGRTQNPSGVKSTNSTLSTFLPTCMHVISLCMYVLCVCVCVCVCVCESLFFFFFEKKKLKKIQGGKQWSKRSFILIRNERNVKKKGRIIANLIFWTCSKIYAPQKKKTSPCAWARSGVKVDWAWLAETLRRLSQSNSTSRGWPTKESLFSWSAPLAMHAASSNWKSF